MNVLSSRLRGTLAFALCQLPLVWLAALRYVPFMEVPHEGWGIVYLLLTWVGHFGLLVLLGWGLLMAPACVLPRRYLWPVAALVATLGLGALLVDTVVYAQYRFHVNYFMVSLFLNDKNGEIFSFSLETWAVVIAVSLALLIAQGWLAHKMIVTGWQRSIPTGRTVGVLLVALFAGHLLHIVADARYMRSVTQQTSVYPLLFPATAKDFMAEHGWLDPRAARGERANIDAREADELEWPLNPLQCSPQSSPNIMLIMIDSWRHDEYDAQTTPHLYAALHQNGRRYTEHYSGGNSTRTGVMSLFYGLTGNYYAYINNTQTPPLLVTEMQRQGYALGIFAAASLDSVGFDRTVFSSVSPLRMGTPGETPHERDARMTDDWRQWLDQHEQTSSSKPWFGMLFYDAPHGYSVPEGADKPFQPSASEMNYLELGPETDPQPWANLHRNSVHHDDQLIGQVIDDLKARGEWDNTVLIVTADHGQSFNDFHKNYWGHNSHFASPQTHVPMILHGPGITPGEQTGMSSHLDVAPMLMRHALGCSNPLSDYAQGGDLLDAQLDHPRVIASSYLDYGIIEPDRITVVDGTGKWKILDRHLDPIEDADFSPAVFNALGLFRQFYEK
ncbi:choline-sulfatase [Kushneria pakistanensis]|uniref:Choline-sulfatase n=1 Tax=Kushneria pakistanensis TaxID=1508770 RepID=A0ABQ3FIT7_9GAMM|nr:DUF3413 domain-containing protein [Kushneria pakistanensis]GHC25597.1 choline-sulfatase [Kushneria pakistanensis]